MDSPSKSKARGETSTKADSTIEGSDLDAYDFDTEADISGNQSTDLSKNQPATTKKIIRSKSKLIIQLSEEESSYRKSQGIDITSDEYAKYLKCTGKCRKKSLRNYVLNGKKIITHPLLGVIFCKSCEDYYGDGDLSMDEDNEDKYCRWCGDGGMLFICSRCVYGFCPRCIKRHFGDAAAKEIEDNDDWLCFFCNPSPLWKLRAVAAAAIAYSKNKKAEKVLAFKKSCVIRSSDESEMKNYDSSSNNSEETNNDIDEEDKKEASSTNAKEETSVGEQCSVVSAQDTSVQDSTAYCLNSTRKRKSSKDGPSESESDKTFKKLKINLNTVNESSEPATNGKADSSVNGIVNDHSSTNNSSNNSSAEPFSIKKARSNLKGMLKITQMTANLCDSICSRRIVRVKHVNSYDSFCKEYDKIAEMVGSLNENLNDIMTTVNILKTELNEGLNGKNGQNEMT